MKIYGKDIDIESQDTNANISLSFSRANMFSFGFDVPRCNIHAPEILPMGEYCCKYPAQIAGGIGLPMVNVCVNAITEKSVNFNIESAGNSDVPIYEMFKDAIVCGCCRPVTPAIVGALQDVGMEVCAVAQYSGCCDCITGGYAICNFMSEPILYYRGEWYCGEFMEGKYALCRQCFGVVCSYDYSGEGWKGDYLVNADGCRCCALDWSQPKASAQLLDANDFTFAWNWNNFVACASCWWECNCGVPITGVPTLASDVAIVMPNTREAYWCAPWSIQESVGGEIESLCLAMKHTTKIPIGFSIIGGAYGGFAPKINCGTDFRMACCNFDCGWRVWINYTDNNEDQYGGGYCRLGFLRIFYETGTCNIDTHLQQIINDFESEFIYQVYQDGQCVNNCYFLCSCNQCPAGSCYVPTTILSMGMPLYCGCITHYRIRKNGTLEGYPDYSYAARVGWVCNTCLGDVCVALFNKTYPANVVSCNSDYWSLTCRYCEATIIDASWSTQDPLTGEDSMCYGCVCLPWIGNFFGCGIIDTIRRVSETYGCYMNGTNVYSPKSEAYTINCEVGYCVYACDLYKCGYCTESDPRFISCNASGEGVCPLLGQLVSREIATEQYCGLPMYDPMHAEGVTGFCGYHYAKMCGKVATPGLNTHYKAFWHGLMSGYCEACYDTGSPVTCNDLADGCRYVDDLCCRAEVAIGRYIEYANSKCAMYHPVGCAGYNRGFALVALNFPICGYIDTNACYYCEYCSGGNYYCYNIPWTEFSYDIQCGCQGKAAVDHCDCIPLYRMLCHPSKNVRLNAVTLTTQPSDTARIISAGVGSCFIWHGARYRVEKIDNYNPSAPTCLKVFGIMV